MQTPDKPTDVCELLKLEARWPQISDQIARALGLVAEKPAVVERLIILYQRSLSHISGSQGEERDFTDLHCCVLAAIQMTEHKWPNVTVGGVREGLAEIPDLKAHFIDEAINIAICLWLGVDCVGQEYGMPKEWPELDTIHHFVLKRRFDDPTGNDVGDPIARFPPKFRAARLQDISGISIEPTYYLDRHLRFNEDTRTLKVFMDAIWLKSMCERFRAIRDEKTPDDMSAQQNAPPDGQSSSASSSRQSTSNQTSKEDAASVCDAHAKSLARARRVPFKGGVCGRR